MCQSLISMSIVWKQVYLNLIAFYSWFQKVISFSIAKNTYYSKPCPPPILWGIKWLLLNWLSLFILKYFKWHKHQSMFHPKYFQVQFCIIGAGSILIVGLDRELPQYWNLFWHFQISLDPHVGSRHDPVTWGFRPVFDCHKSSRGAIIVKRQVIFDKM